MYAIIKVTCHVEISYYRMPVATVIERWNEAEVRRRIVFKTKEIISAESGVDGRFVDVELD